MSKSIKSSSELGMISGYRLEYEEYLPDVSGCGLVFRHIKSGARICVISNDDKNNDDELSEDELNDILPFLQSGSTESNS